MLVDPRISPCTAVATRPRVPCRDVRDTRRLSQSAASRWSRLFRTQGNRGSFGAGDPAGGSKHHRGWGQPIAARRLSGRAPAPGQRAWSRLVVWSGLASLLAARIHGLLRAVEPQPANQPVFFGGDRLKSALMIEPARRLGMHSARTPFSCLARPGCSATRQSLVLLLLKPWKSQSALSPWSGRSPFVRTHTEAAICVGVLATVRKPYRVCLNYRQVISNHLSSAKHSMGVAYVNQIARTA